MKKYFVCSDIHSFYDVWQIALNDAGFDVNNQDHIIIVCGDLLDRGNKPIECIRFVLSLPKERTILIKGNHEYLLEELLGGREVMWYDYSNGTAQTYLDIKCLECEELVHNYYERLIDYAEVGNNVFVHGWLPKVKNYKRAGKSSWKEASWTNGIDAYYANGGLKGKRIFIGHWHCSYAWALEKGCSQFDVDAIFDTYVKNDFVALDACTAYTHKVNIFTFEL